MRLLVDPPASGAWNMAVDEALMATARSGSITLRLYRWDPPCLSLGRNQSGAFAAEGRPGVDVVRRPTGGRSVYHHRELTYSVTLPQRLWGGPRTTYARVNRALAEGLRRLGVQVAVAGSGDGDTSPVSPRACFGDPAPGELVARGRKLVGSAQWRHAGALLQHGSLLFEDDQGLAVPGHEISDGSAAIGLSELLPRLPEFEELVGALQSGFETEFGVRVERVELSQTERSAAYDLEEVYGSPGWTWSRQRLPSATQAS